MTAFWDNTKKAVLNYKIEYPFYDPREFLCLLFPTYEVNISLKILRLLDILDTRLLHHDDGIE